MIIKKFKTKYEDIQKDFDVYSKDLRILSINGKNSNGSQI